MEDIDKKLEILRKEWREHPSRRWIIIRQARALQLAKEKRKKRLLCYKSLS